jgi:hypothetical protein
MTAPAACVIARQYSSSTFVSLRFRSRKEKFDTRFKNAVISFLPFLKMRKS